MAAPCGHCGQLHEAYVTMCPVTGARLGSAAYTLVDEDESLVGSVVGERYHLRDMLGQGATGTVFATVHVHFERAGAMKVLRPRFAPLDTVQRVFHNEARPAFAVSHPSLCEVFDIGTLPDGAPFFVMERLEGDTLASRLGRERFSIAAAVDLMMQLLSAMEALHAREILLRDLRPQNLFLAQRRGCRPVLKILDLGLSRLLPLERVEAQWDGLRAAVGGNQSAGLLSVPYYLSPERARGEQGLEPSSDLFVASVIFYEALTGQKPFHGSTWNALLGQIAQAQPTPISVLRPDVPEELGALLMRALSASPRQRPASAREMQDELRAVFEGPRRGSASMRAAPASSPTPAAPRSDRERADHLAPFMGLPLPVPGPRLPADERQHLDVTVSAQVDARARAEAMATVDEASAEHPIRTMRPPSVMEVEVDVDVEMESLERPPATTRAVELPHATATAAAPRITEEDEETETMQLTPELRARIEEMTKAAPVGAASDSTRPPPTRRLTKPAG